MRRADREVVDIEIIKEILDKSYIIHLGMSNDDEPYVVPLHYGYVFMDDKITFYIHGAKVGKKYEFIKNNPKVFVQIDCDMKLIDGEDNPCKYSAEYASFMGKGEAFIVENVEEKIKGLKILMKTQVNREFEFNENMVNGVNVIKIVVKEYSAKKRSNDYKVSK